MHAFRAMILAAAMIAAAATAQADELTGTLKHIRDTGVITIGSRESSVPFSYLDRREMPIGYSIDLCGEIVDAISQELDGRDIMIVYKSVTPQSRIAALLSGEIDLECGSTTNNTARQRQVAFSPTIFVTGTKLLVRKGGGIRSWRDLKGKTVAVTAGTTNEAAMRVLAEKQKLELTFEVAPDHAQAFELVAAGKADAFAMDDILLHGLIATTKDGKETFEVVGDYLSYDPYGIMFRREDPQLAAVVERTFRRLAEQRELPQIYNRWFMKRLPSGERFNLAIGPQLEEMWHAIGLPD
jgi:glutamate/aspartate transport system substrate-binding protein